MGPNLVFDKSFLQCLSVDESVWLDAFFCGNITPVFFMETLADLDKGMTKGRTPEQVVGNLALKTPDIDSYCNQFHVTILSGELMLGEKIDMETGRPMVGGGRATHNAGRRGVVFEEAPEEKAFNRWQRKQYVELEREQARRWRAELAALTPSDQETLFAGWFGNHRPSLLSEVKRFVDDYLNTGNTENVLSFGLDLIGVHPDAKSSIIARWKREGSPDLESFAPYFRHILGVDIFFYLSRSAGLISDRRTNFVDIAYLYYLPFSMVFASSDKLHQNVAPLFLRADQSFVWGPDLKHDLGELDAYYSKLPEEVKARGLHAFASFPPVDRHSLVTELWDKHMKKNWRTLVNRSASHDLQHESELIERIKQDRNAPSVDDTAPRLNSDDLDYVTKQRFVFRRKGKWNRLPSVAE